MIYSFEHMHRDGETLPPFSHPYTATTARRARAHARSLAAQGWSFTVYRWTWPGHRWFRSHRRRALRRDPDAVLRPWTIPQWITVLPDRWWRS